MPVGGGVATDYAAVTDQLGYLTVPQTGLQPGDYLWRLKNGQTLANGGSATLQPGQNLIEIGLTSEGDADDSNCVNVADFTLLKDTYGKSLGEEGYDGRADFTGDNVVTVLDFALLKANFSRCGVPPFGSSTPTATATVTSTPTQTPAAGVRLVGHITIAGRTAPPSSRQSVTVTLSLRPVAGGPSTDFTSITDDYGYVTMTGALEPGIYNWRIKNAQTLALAGTTALAVGDNQVEMGVFSEGDADDSNCVSAQDFVILKLAFGRSPGEPGYDARADFNGDDVILTQDFTLLRSNFNQCGAGPISVPP
jgi:hypothetical protein